MIEIKYKHQCCGCASCVQKCPKKCITLIEDCEGFLYPHVNHSVCIDCGLCEKVCPIITPLETRKPLQVFAVINKDDTIRMSSSSGGIFTLLAEKIIHEGGVVFGARFDDDWQVTLDYTQTIEGLSAFRGSKYVQARTGDTFKQCEKFLIDGRKVLFTGSPCQIAGLHHYLRKEYNNLITCDFVCHGVPSPKVWKMYLNEVVDATNKAITDIKFRNKDNGWKSFNFKLTYIADRNMTIMSSCHRQNIYMRAFLSNLILRPSCHECYSKEGRSNSDITIADFWKIQLYHPDMDDDKGTGLVMINTEKGKKIIDWSKTRYKETDYETALLTNRGLKPSAIPHKNRSNFFRELGTTDSLCRLIIKDTKPSIGQKFYQALGLFKRIIKKMTRYDGLLTKSAILRHWGGGEYHVDSFPHYIPMDNSSITDINFRNKQDGWKQYNLTIVFKLKK